MRKRLFTKKLLQFVSVAVLPMLFLFISIYTIVSINISNDVKEYSQKVTLIGNKQLESILDIANDQYLVFNSNPSILFTLKKMVSEKEMNYRDLASQDAIYSILNSAGNSLPYVRSIYLYLDNTNGYFLKSSEKLQRIESASDQNWLNHYQDYSGGLFWIDKRQTKLDSFGREQTVVSIFKKFTAAEGVMVINIIPELLNSYLDAIQSYKNEAIIITNNEGEILFHNTNAAHLGLHIADTFIPGSQSAANARIDIENVAYHYSEANSLQYDLKFISLVPHATIYKVLYSLIPYFILVTFAALIIAFITSYYRTKQNFQHIDYILENLHLAETGAAPFATPHKYQNEYDLILDNILKTYLMNALLKEKMNESQLRQRSAEMLALQLQINPHFLFNTLQTIKIHSMQGDRKNTTESAFLIDNLSDILKYSLENSSSTVMLQDEINACKKYIDIQHRRYKNRFFCFWEYSDELLDLQIPHLLIQPLIENSLHHGIKGLNSRDGMIKVKINRTSSGSICIAVIDNGIGISKERTVVIQEMLEIPDDGITFNTHIGLKNVNMRLVLLYGKESGIKLQSKEGMGTIVSFLIP